MPKLGYWGVHICGCAGWGLEVVPCWWSLYMCVGFFLWRRSCVFILSSCWGWGRLLLSLFWCDCSALFPGAPAVFRCVSCCWLPFSGSSPCWLRLAALLLRWTFSLGLGVSWFRCPDTPLGFLPCAGTTPPSASSPLRFCTLGGCVSVSVSCLLLGLGWRGLCYVTWFSPMCHALPQGLQLAQPSQLQAILGFFRSPGVCPSTSLVAWVGLQPFPSFSGLLLLRLLAGVGGVMLPVSGCSSYGGVCLVCRCGHPAALPFP